MLGTSEEVNDSAGFESWRRKVWGVSGGAFAGRPFPSLLDREIGDRDDVGAATPRARRIGAGVLIR
ncbi:hypothetical protein NGM36_09185 [Streptomyces mutabilis]|uniref:hypothetical protein n=1 Tax=Streptomyces mutabilis TaxID=67332 RepID=UPI0022BA545F|nr:hypothetical protein [Streptomyces mutabilis]MCZ9349963.1 hypothetical protein [Streptomyces mutabilis]